MKNLYKQIINSNAKSGNSKIVLRAGHACGGITYTTNTIKQRKKENMNTLEKIPHT
jgi:hypothetical protein